MRSLFLLILLIPIFAFSEIVTVRSGNFIEVMNLDKSNHVQARMYEKYEKNGQLWKGDVSKRLKMGLPVGQMSKNTLPVVLQHTVDKKSVMRGLLANARAGGRLASRNPWVFIAFTLVGDELIDKATEMTFAWDSDAGDYMTTADYKADVVYKNVYVWGTLGFTTQQISTGASTYSGKVLTACQSNASKLTEFVNDKTTYNFVNLTNSSGKEPGQFEKFFQCNYQNEKQVSKSIFIYIVKNNKRAITQDEFDKIMIPIADNSPSEYVNASRPSQNEAPLSFSYVGVTATSGASVETDAYTDPRDGKAKETKVTINADGKTVTIQDTLRPDLQGDTETAPVPEPLPETKPDPGGETTPETEQTPFCELYPDVLACQKMGDGSEAESIFSDIKIPEITNPAEFKLDNFLPDNGSCPAPKTYSTSHGSIIYSYEKHCDVARTLRPFLIAFASVTALYLIFFRKA